MIKWKWIHLSYLICLYCIGHVNTATLVIYLRFWSLHYLIWLTLQIDTKAVKDSTDEDLYKLGLLARGDILALAEYSNRTNFICNISDKSDWKKLLWNPLQWIGVHLSPKVVKVKESCLLHWAYQIHHWCP